MVWLCFTRADTLSVEAMFHQRLLLSVYLQSGCLTPGGVAPSNTM